MLINAVQVGNTALAEARPTNTYLTGGEAELPAMLTKSELTTRFNWMLDRCAERKLEALAAVVQKQLDDLDNAFDTSFADAIRTITSKR